ncbi:putative transcriptional activator protein TraR (plasmid) [Hartmannibacter diazotrophicus]|uniref:Putative transcriptional activator protein TraR n=1 Tax=Hartmannibacter diazotrophicus TaxID=1482074 RepID=A0A2C9DE32_9HYPH|nr:LuxR C-terminal-related transcriptional regulator [Hartmannibacter diazotrophicus]SON58439.1 putative transcriptional activator protein TraR [Hartmannibacter diazotrophicus]
MIGSLLHRIAARYSLQAMAYIGLGMAPCQANSPLLAAAYSSRWINRNRGWRYMEIEPALRFAFQRLLPLDWEEISMPGELLNALRRAMGEHDKGQRGVTVPVHGYRGDLGLLSLSSEVSIADWKRWKLCRLSDFQVLAVHLHERVLRLEGQATGLNCLSPREMECLQWIAEGKTAWECAAILGLSQSTVRHYLESARRKLRAVSNTHAVSIAHRTGLIFL